MISKFEIKQLITELKNEEFINLIKAIGKIGAGEQKEALYLMGYTDALETVENRLTDLLGQIKEG